MVVRRLPAPALRRAITEYHGFRSDEPPTRRHEGPGADVVLILSLDHSWRIDGERRVSFVGGLRLDQVVTESEGGGMHGLQVPLAPWAAHMLLRVPQAELAGASVPLEDLLSVDLAARIGAEESWGRTVRRPRSRARPPARGSAPAGCRGRLRVGAATRDARLTPKAAARLLRFERARSLAGTMSWGELAFACGFADQPHLIAEFRAFTGSTPETFLQDAAVQAA